MSTAYELKELVTYNEMKQHYPLPLNWITGISCLVTLVGVYMVNMAINRNKQSYERSK